MSSAGHVLDMIKRSRYNDSIKQSRVERMNKIKDIFQEEIRKHNHINFKNKEVSAQELGVIKAGIRSRMKMERRRVWLSTVLFTLLTMVLCSALLYAWLYYVG